MSFWDAFKPPIMRDVRSGDEPYKSPALGAVEFLPGAGEAMDAAEIAQELEKDEPDWYKVGTLGGLALIGTVPVLGDLAAKSGRTAYDAMERGAAAIRRTEEPIDASTPAFNSEVYGEPDFLTEEEVAPYVSADTVTKQNISEEQLAIFEAATGKSREEIIAGLPDGKVETWKLTDEEMEPYASNPFFKPDSIETNLRIDEDLYKDFSKIQKYNQIDLERYADEPEVANNLINQRLGGYKLHNEVPRSEMLKMASEFPHPLNPDFNARVSDLEAKLIGMDFTEGEAKGAIAQLRAMSNEGFGKSQYNRDTNEWLQDRPIWDRMRPIGMTEGRPVSNEDAASALGMTEDVFHYSSSPEEFSQFGLKRELEDGFTKQDLMGVHVGSPRAAVDRNLDVRVLNKRSGQEPDVGHTMRMRAKTDSPLYFDKIEELGFMGDQYDYTSSFINDGIATEQDLNMLYNHFEDKSHNPEIKKYFEELGPEDHGVVAFRRYLADKGITHIPYVNDMEDKGNVSYIMLTDRGGKTPAVLRDWSAKFDPDKQYEEDLRFAEGGAVMLKTDGMNKDPISGNDVPLGSTAKEVRDDVDAKLSEGEYVLPADVVRYFGLEKIEEMVSAAKEGINEMGAKGRIGGEPAPMSDDEMLAQANMAFNQGGVVPGAPSSVPGSNVSAPDIDALLESAKARAERDPEFAQLLDSKGISIRAQTTPMAKPPANNMGAPVAMAEGGAVFGQTPYNPSAFRSDFNPYGHTPGFMGTVGSGAMSNAASAPVDQSKMCGPGTVWDEEKQMCIPEKLEPSVTKGDGGGGGAAPQGDPNAWMKKFDYSNPETLYEQTMSTLDAGEKDEEKGGLLGAIGGLLEGGILGKFTATTSAAQAMANARVLRAQGRGDLADKIEAQYSTFVEEKGISMIPETWRDGDRLAEDIMEVHGSSIEGWGSKSTGTSTGAGLGAKPTPLPEPSRHAPKNASRDDGPSHAEIMAKHDTIREKKKADASNALKTSASAGQKVIDKAKSYGQDTTQMEKENKRVQESLKNISKGGSGGFNKGGLVQRRKKKK